jgi:hypothetical protein
MRFSLISAALGVALGACYPGNISDGDAQEFDAVTTIFDQDAGPRRISGCTAASTMCGNCLTSA